MKTAAAPRATSSPPDQPGDTDRSTRTGHGGPGGRSATAIALVVVVGGLMSVLDVTIVNVALNHLAQDFGAPLSVVQWIVTAYSLALATVMPVTAWASARFGTKRLYMLAIGLFAAGSLLAGLAWSIESLIAFRVLQGLGGGMIMPVGMTIVIRAADKERMGRTMALMGIPVLVGPMAGPVLGGWLIDNISWRWMFFINLPIGVAALALAAWIFPRDTAASRDSGKRLDVPGLLMLSPGLAALIYGMTAAGEDGGIAAPGVLLPILAGAALVVGFVFRQLRTRHPLMDLRLFRERTFAAGAVVMALFPLAYFGSMLLTPLYYQLVHGQSATAAGLLGIPQVLATGIMMQVAGRLVDRFPPGRIVLTGITLASAGFGAFVLQVSADAPLWQLAGTLFFMGAGVGMTMMPTMTTVSRHLSHEQAPVGAATLNIISQVAAAIGTALVSVLLSGAMADRLPAPADDGLGALHGLSERALQTLAPGLADAFQHTYGWAVALMALALIPALLLPRHRLVENPEETAE